MTQPSAALAAYYRGLPAGHALEAAARDITGRTAELTGFDIQPGEQPQLVLTFALTTAPATAAPQAEER
jgi:hypothetical protein